MSQRIPTTVPAGPPGPAGAADTHEVHNQPPPLEGASLYESDVALVEGLQREAGAGNVAAFEPRVAAWGAWLGRPETRELGAAANRFPPELRTHDRYGHRIDEVAFHPAWHAVMGEAMRRELHNLPWLHPVRGAQTARAAMLAMLAQIEAGSCCPLTMTFAAMPVLRHEKDLVASWEEKLLGTRYDPRPVPAAQKEAVLIGMAMTEKQGGSDVRANTTRAEPAPEGAEGGGYRLTGHKWFCSAPMSDAFLTLAQTGAGLTCFLVPRFRPDGERNAFHLQRLKDKLGNRSNASSEIEYRDTFAWRIGEEGRGVRTILEMVQHTRLDCVSGSSGLLRRGVAEALHHARHRQAFGRRLADQPLMRNVLADLALESEAATALMLRLARAFEPLEDGRERAFARLATAVGKYWVCKRAPHALYEAMECLGGNGYVEESLLPRLYREAPVNAIWEGSGNVIALDVLRAMVREPEALEAFLAEVRAAGGADRRLDAWIRGLEAELAEKEDAELRARRLVERMALALQGALLVQHGPPAVADAFCASRLAEDAGPRLAFGTLPPGLDLEPILQRAAPRI